MTTITAAPANIPTRRPYHGSCHCGLTRYITFLTLPPPLISALPPDGPTSTTRMRKCNCSTCHKASFFHVRPMSSSDDFALLSPIAEDDGGGAHGGIRVDGEAGLKDYTCFRGRIHWYFCSRCGVRCFAFAGEGEIRDVVYTGDQGREEKVRGWAPKREGWKEGLDNGCYLSLNAVTLEPGQEGFDLREWHEKGWIVYLDVLNDMEEARLGRPCEGGMY